MEKLSRADLLVINGLGLEEFLDAQIRNAGERLKVVDGSAGSGDLLPAAGEETCSHHPDCVHAAHGHANPHLFASPRRIARIAVRIAEALSEADPAGAELYGRNARAYADRMNALAGEMAGRVAAFPKRRIVQPHGIFDYLARDIGLEIVAVTQAQGQDPSAAEMLAILKRIRETKAAAVITEPRMSPRAAQTLAREAGLPVIPLDPAASGPEEAPLDYVEKVMRANLEALQAVLGR
jgi:ABC-type Zn uptake system ZnuABC Zn-binding protein ZnuA